MTRLEDDVASPIGEESPRDVMDAGSDREPLLPRVGDLARRHPFVSGALGLAVLVAGGVAAYVATRPPTIPDARIVAQPSEGRGPDGLALDPAGAVPISGPTDGATRAPLTLTWRLRLEWEQPPGSDVTVRGVTGPGLTPTGTRLVQAGKLTSDVTLVSTLDCASLRWPVDPAAYGVTLAATEGGRTGVRTLDSGAAHGDLARAVETVCAGWDAAHDLVVTGVDTQVSDTRAEVDLTLQVRNDGPRDAALSTVATPGAQVRLNPVSSVVPAGGSIAVRARLSAVDCTARDYTPDASWLPLVRGWEGPAQPLSGAADAPTWIREPGEPGTIPAGVSWDGDAQKQVVDSVFLACGDLSQSVLLVPQHGVQLDREQGLAYVDIHLDLPIGRVSGVRLAALPNEARAEVQPGRYAPAWTTTPVLVPDASGQVRTTLTYRSPGLECPREGGWLPTFEAQLQVPEGDRVRVVPLRLTINVSQDRYALRQLCGD